MFCSRDSKASKNKKIWYLSWDMSDVWDFKSGTARAPPYAAAEKNKILNFIILNERA